MISEIISLFLLIRTTWAPFPLLFAPVVLLKMYYCLVCLLIIIIIINYIFHHTKCGSRGISLSIIINIIVVFIRLLILI